MDKIYKMVRNKYLCNMLLEQLGIGHHQEKVSKKWIILSVLPIFTFSSSTLARVELGVNASATGRQSTAIGDETKAMNHQTVAVGANSEALGYASVAIGGDDIVNNTAVGRAERAKFLDVTGQVLSTHYRSTTAAGTASLALGSTALAKGAFSSALGVNSTASGFAGVAMGIQSTASADASLALGSASVAGGINSAALGASAKASALNSTALGSFSKALSKGATALGTMAVASGNDSLALGTNSSATGHSSVALGHGAVANVSNSVALGTDSTTTVPSKNSFLTNRAASDVKGVVSVGNVNMLRRIQNVADGAGDQDAVTVAQVKIIDNKLNQTNRNMDRLKNDLENSLDYTNKRMNQLSKEANAGVAAAIAVAALAQPTEKGYTMLAVGSGVWDGETGFSVGASGVTHDKKILNKPINYIWKFASTTNSQGKWGGGASIGVQWQ